jgi:uncharacterized protein YndB with AHSA1/START domain
MGTVTARQSATISAPAATAYRLIADDAERVQWLPDAVKDFTVLEGGTGTGTVHSFTVVAGGRQRDYVMDVEEQGPGRALVETDRNSSLVTTYTVTGTEPTCEVEIVTTWNGASGVGGFFERTFAPKALGKIYAEQLARLDAHARAQA